MLELFKQIQEKSLDIECWNRGLKKYKIQKLTNTDNQINISMNNDDKIVINKIDNMYTISINKVLKYKETTINYNWIKDLYQDFLIKKGAKLI